MLKVRTKIGDIFAVRQDASMKYFQYVADDSTQLNSEVIRAFKSTYPIDASADLTDIVAGEIDFYAHVVIAWGIRKHLWEKVGNVPFTGKLTALFRRSSDYGDRSVRTSSNWYVWRVNEEFQPVSKLEADHRKADIGIVVTPEDVIDRRRTGEYHFSYPGYA
jgi:hypothetical protein